VHFVNICVKNQQILIQIGVFVGFSCIFLLRILIFTRLTARRLYKSFDVKGLRGDKPVSATATLSRNYEYFTRGMMHVPKPVKVTVSLST
jgi:hypothetical protein